MPDIAAKIPLRERINFRLVVFSAVVALVVGYPLYLYVESEVTGGIKDAGGGYMEVDLKAMSTFNFSARDGTIEDVPRQWRDLNGKKVVLYGEIAPTTFSARGANEFDLVYSVAKCCYVGTPQVQHFVESRMISGNPVEYYSGLVKVRGILHVAVKRSGGQVSSVYQLDVESLEPA